MSRKTQINSRPIRAFLTIRGYEGEQERRG